MRINVKYTEKLDTAIKEAEGKATARCVTAKQIVDILNNIRVPKSRLHGTMVRYDGAEHFPNCYRWTPHSTHWTAVNHHGRWYVTDIWRDVCPNRVSYQTRITYSESAKAWILDNASKI